MSTTVTFADDQELVHLEFEVSPETFKVDRPRRQLSGLLLPWGQTARSGFARWKFARGSLTWSDVGRVKLLRDHDTGQPVGRALALDDREDGLYGTFSVARGAAGDEVLSLAEDGVLDGFSVGPLIEPSGWEIDRQDRDARLVTNGRLVEVTVTAVPAFDDARVTRVAAMRGKGQSMPDENKPGGTAPGAAAGTTVLEKPEAAYEKFTQELEQRFSAVADQVGKSMEKQQEAIGNTIAAAFDAAFGRMQDIGADDNANRAAARWKVVKEPPTYRFDGDVKASSLVRDSWNWHHNGDYDARDRLKKFQDQQADIVKFAQVNTTSASDVIPPGYRPDLFVTQLMQGRPIVAQSSRGTITDATPFTVPKFIRMADDADTGGLPTSDHTEGVNPTPGKIVVGSTVVQPVAISGIFELTREIVDSSNPAIDAIAMAAMRESWNQQTEAKGYTALNGAADAANTTTFAAASVITDVRGLLADYPFVRFAAPTGAVINQKVTSTFATTNGTDGRPLLPSVGAENSSGLGNAVAQGWFIDGLPFVPAWAMTDGVADDVAIVANRADYWTWESPLLTFRFEEKRGPGIVELALFGYYATHVLRAEGIFAIRNP